MLPEIEKIAVPGDVSGPIFAHSVAPSSMIEGTLAIDPEDLNAHYNLMRVYRAMGDRKNADLEDAAYRKYKDDESIRAIDRKSTRLNSSHRL